MPPAYRHLGFCRPCDRALAPRQQGRAGEAGELAIDTHPRHPPQVRPPQRTKRTNRTAWPAPTKKSALRQDHPRTRRGPRSTTAPSA
eukprot:2045551-Alexandrium_andersonii.AAC.1